MSRIAYVNGRYVPLRDAVVNVEDRGYQFSDGVYEVCEVKGGKLVDERQHLERLARSLGELRIAMPMSTQALGVVFREVVRRNRVRWGILYLQISRGVARRDHAFPAPSNREDECWVGCPRFPIRPAPLRFLRLHDVEESDDQCPGARAPSTRPGHTVRAIDSVKRVDGA